MIVILIAMIFILEKIGNKKHLVIPYTLDNNDMRLLPIKV